MYFAETGQELLRSIKFSQTLVILRCYTCSRALRTWEGVGTSYFSKELRDRHPDQHSIDTLSTPQLTLSQHSLDISVDIRLIFYWCIRVSWHLANYGPTVDQVSIECRLNIGRDVNRVSIEMLIKGIDWGYRSMLDCGCLLNSYTWCELGAIIKHFMC